MTDFRIREVILSPADVATRRQWRCAVCAIYAGIILILGAAWGLHQLVTPGDDAQIDRFIAARSGDGSQSR